MLINKHIDLMQFETERYFESRQLLLDYHHFLTGEAPEKRFRSFELPHVGSSLRFKAGIPTEKPGAKKKSTASSSSSSLSSTSSAFTSPSGSSSATKRSAASAKSGTASTASKQVDAFPEFKYVQEKALNLIPKDFELLKRGKAVPPSNPNAVANPAISALNGVLTQFADLASQQPVQEVPSSAASQERPASVSGITPSLPLSTSPSQANIASLASSSAALSSSVPPSGSSSSQPSSSSPSQPSLTPQQQAILIVEQAVRLEADLLRARLARIAERGRQVVQELKDRVERFHGRMDDWLGERFRAEVANTGQVVATVKSYVEQVNIRSFSFLLRHLCFLSLSLSVCSLSQLPFDFLSQY